MNTSFDIMAKNSHHSVIARSPRRSNLAFGCGWHQYAKEIRRAGGSGLPGSPASLFEMAGQPDEDVRTTRPTLFNPKSKIINPKSFTLIELLVVVAIIAVLVAILLPALTEARDRARIIACAAQEKQLGQAIFSYANINNSFIPISDGTQYNEWTPLPSPYFYGFVRDGGISNLDLFYCPTDLYLQVRKPGEVYLFYNKPYIGYGYLTYRIFHDPWVTQWRRDNRPLTKIDKGYNDETPPSNCLLMVDKAMTGPNPSVFGSGNHSNSDGWIKGANHLYGDSHVQWWKQFRHHPYWGWDYVPLYHLLWD